MNRLQFEKSPYLLQHAANPVDWFPWGKEAFDKAAREDKPVFLSIGYSTCHWCHVMAHESFEDEEVAALLNGGFVCVKVDREERPDVDAVYMAVCQALTGSGGWPLSVVMTPGQIPFFAATYLPKSSRYGQTGLHELLPEIARLWKEKRQSLIEAGERIVSHLSQAPQIRMENPSRALPRRAMEQFQKSFDRHWGGFGCAPKFPMPHQLIFLLRYARLENRPEALQMAECTLKAMARGGIFDQIGGGFSRYSTDAKWLIPHFEKMLYDNALLLFAYTEAYQITGSAFYRTVAQRTAEYLLREMTDPLGGFYSGQDADSGGEEGKYYAFTPEEIADVLGEREGSAFCERFGIGSPGNFEGKSIPNLIASRTYEEESPEMAALRCKLYVYRLERISLAKDDKILTAWNALAIAALSQASFVLQNRRCLSAALLAQQFLDASLTGPDGRLLVRWREGEAAHPGQLEDYAFSALALLCLYRNTFELRFLEQAVRRAEQMLRFFEDRGHGGFFLYAEDAEQLITRPKESYDGALPSGNSVAGLVLQRLFHLTGQESWRAAGERQLAFLAGEMESYPAGYSCALLAVLEAVYPSAQLVCVTREETAPPKLLERLRREAPLNLSVLLKTPQTAERLAALAPFTREYPIPASGCLFYLCRNGSCSAPTAELSALSF